MPEENAASAGAGRRSVRRAPALSELRPGVARPAADKRRRKSSIASEVNNEPSSRAAGLQPTMSLTGSFWRVDLCDAKRDYSGLDLLT